MSGRTSRAVVLARGLGTRMRQADSVASLTPDQVAAADAGLKPMLPVNGRPFLDYVLSALADAGLTDVALVVAPDHRVMRQYYEMQSPPERVRLSFVVQPEPLGTADAVAAAREWTDDAPFLVMNADNLYPTNALVDLAALDEPGLLVFERDDLVRSGNIPAERVLAFALVHVDSDGYLGEIVEKPSEPIDNPASEALVSMNCWRFDPRIFDACREVRPSPRGELELPEAVSVAMRRGVRFRALRARGPVLDLSRRADAGSLVPRLSRLTPRP
jgi:dTDP-glucose pyrophosphorylase